MREAFTVYTDILEPLRQALTLMLLRFTRLKKLLIAIVVPIFSIFIYIFVAYNVSDRYAWSKLLRQQSLIFSKPLIEIAEGATTLLIGRLFCARA
jgi:hypothetical protein